MTTDELRESRAKAYAFVEDHLPECAGELLEWHDTGELVSGHVRELARLCAPWSTQAQALHMAERLVNHTALRKAAGLL